MNYGNLEKIENIIYRPYSNFNILNVVTLGNRDNIGAKKDVMRRSSYKSSKYSNIDYVDKIVLESNDFIVFQYTGSDKKEELFISYPHIYNTRTIFSNIFNMLEEGEVFGIGEENIPYVKQEYINYVEYIECTGNKQLALYFSVLDIENEVDSTIEYIEGVTFVFNSDDYQVTVPLNSFYNLYLFIMEFNLHQSSQNLLLLSYMSEMSKALNLENNLTADQKKGKITGGRGKVTIKKKNKY